MSAKKRDKGRRRDATNSQSADLCGHFRGWTHINFMPKKPPKITWRIFNAFRRQLRGYLRDHNNQMPPEADVYMSADERDIERIVFVTPEPGGAK